MVAFVVKDKKVLLLKHSYQYAWALPGGWMKRGEGLTSTMEREIMEEIGLRVRVTEILDVISIKERPVIDVLVKCEVISGKIQVDNVEVEKAVFFSFDSLPEQIVRTHKPYIQRFLNS